MDPTNEKSFHSIGEMQAHLMAKASNDPDFRELLVANPRGAINEEFGLKVPDNVKFVVHESDLSTIHLTLPPDFEELGEEQLEAVSGGVGCTCT